MKADRPARAKGPQRPVWLIAVVLAAGMSLVASAVAFAAHIHAYVILLYSFCIGISGGVFAALWTDRLRLSSARRVALTGAGFGLVIYGLYWFLLYRMTYWGADNPAPFREYVWLLANTTALGRRGRTLFDIGPWFWIAICMAEIVVVVWSSSAVARKVHKAFGAL